MERREADVAMNDDHAAGVIVHMPQHLLIWSGCKLPYKLLSVVFFGQVG